MELSKKCCICKNDAKIVTGAVYFSITCPRCGYFFIEEFLESDLQTAVNSPAGVPLSNRIRAIVSSIIRQQGDKFSINENNIKYLFEMRDISILEKSDKLLLCIEKEIYSDENFHGAIQIDIKNPALQATCWAMNQLELETLCILLVQRGYIKCDNFYGNTQITASGWERLEQLRSPNKDSAQGFVAMWFDTGMNAIYESVFAPAIQTAGYDAHRVDKREHIDKIDDEIILQIRRSRFVIADATGHRGGVYYEAGFAKGLGLDVFWTCREDYMKDLHFDVRQYNCIVWEAGKLDEFRTALARRIEAVLGRGPHPSL